MGDSLCPETLVESRQAISTAKATEKTALLALNQVYFEDFIVKHPKLDEEIKAMVKQREEIMSFRFFRKVRRRGKGPECRPDSDLVLAFVSQAVDHLTKSTGC